MPKDNCNCNDKPSFSSNCPIHISEAEVQIMRKDDEEVQDYIAQKIQDRGYPGIGSLEGGNLISAHDKEIAAKALLDPAVWVERIAPGQAAYEFHNIPNDQAMRIIMRTLPKALELYLNKSKDYGGNVMDRFGLGEKAAIPDMTRKFGKLIDSIWHGKELKYEQPDEVLMDLLGHILIILDQRRTDHSCDDIDVAEPK